MKWINHIAVASATTAILKPELIPLAVLGSTAPDWIETLLKLCGRRVEHRTVTHYVIYWVMGIIFGVYAWDFHHVITAFSYGGFTHIFCDSLTIMGVPVGWWSDRRLNLFGARFRTGQMGEYWFAGSVVLISIGVVMLTRQWGGEHAFTPFFYDWAGFYNAGLIDGHEWKENRFRWL